MGAGRVAALFATLGLVSAGCPSGDGGRPRNGTGREAGRSPDAASRAMPVDGLRLSLPPGWTATPEGSEALVIGRSGRRIARLSPSHEEDLPTREELREALEREVRAAPRVRLEEVPVATDTEGEPETVGPEAVSWLGRLESEDAGTTWVGLCARRVGEAGVFLMGTLPGASEADARTALGVCASLSWGPAPR